MIGLFGLLNGSFAHQFSQFPFGFLHLRDVVVVVVFIFGCACLPGWHEFRSNGIKRQKRKRKWLRAADTKFFFDLLCISVFVCHCLCHVQQALKFSATIYRCPFPCAMNEATASNSVLSAANDRDDRR